MKLSQQARAAIQQMIQTDMAELPEQLGIDNFLSPCEVINLDPYAWAVFPRWITVALPNEYRGDVWYRGGITGLAVGDFVTVVHMREGNRYEVIGPGGSTGAILPALTPRQWVADNAGNLDFEPDNPVVVTTAGVVTEYATIAAAIAAAAATDSVVIPPGTYNENITLKANVQIVELFTGTVRIIATGGTATVTCADDGYINVYEIGIDRDVNAVIYAVDGAAAPTAGNECTVIAEVISAYNEIANVNARAVLVGTAGIAGTLYVFAKRGHATSGTGTGSACYLYGFNCPSTGIINLYIDRVYVYGQWGLRTIDMTSASGFIINLWGGEVRTVKTVLNNYYIAIYTSGVNINMYHQTWYVYNPAGNVWIFYPYGDYAVDIAVYHSDFYVDADSGNAIGVEVWTGEENITVTFQHFTMRAEASGTGQGFVLEEAASSITLWYGWVNTTTTDLVQTAGLLRIHAVEHYTTSGAIAFIGHTGVNNFTVGAGAITILPNAAGDVTAILTAMYAVSESAGGTAGGTATLAPGASVNLYNDGVDILALAVGAGGDVTLQRTAGAATFDVSLNMVWI